MLLNTWLSAARRNFNMKSGTRRAARAASRHSGSVESLETRSLLTALVINPDTRAGYLNAAGGLVIDNADMVGKDSLVIEGFSISASSGNALTINLSGITLRSLAIESMVVTQHTSVGIDISLTNVIGLHTIAVEDVTVAGSRLGLDMTLNNTDTDALTIDDSSIPGVRIEALGGADIGQGLITESSIVAGAGVEGVLLNVNAGSADNFVIKDNIRISSPNRDFIRLNATNSPTDGLEILNNQIGTSTQGSGLSFRADGDTFVQPLALTNNSTRNELIRTFVFDLSAIGLQFDDNATTGRAFTPQGGTGATTGFRSAVLNANKQILTVTFDTTATSNFAPGETLLFVIDIDLVGPTPASIFGDDLIGADIRATFTNAAATTNFNVAGQMIGDPNKVTASEFAIGPQASGNTQGILLNLSNSPTTNLKVSGNTVAGTPGHAFQINAAAFSDVTGEITGNEFLGAGGDGLNFSMVDSNFTGAVRDNNIANNGGNGIAILPSVSRTGLVEALIDSNPVVITSTNHGLSTGARIMIQGLVNDNPNINHPANGLRTITRIDNNRFSVNVSGLATGVRYVGGGAWYVPQFQPDGSARGLVTVDMQAAVPTGIIRVATNTTPVIVNSPDHGLVTGQWIRVSNVAGNTAANGVKRVTVVDADRFRLDATPGNGVYDTSAGFGSWTANAVTAASNTNNILITSPIHGLKTGDEIRITGVLGNTAANGTFKVTVVNANQFRVSGVVGNGNYAGGGNWVRIADATSTGDLVPQSISDNLITGNLRAGIFTDLTTGTVFNGDVVGNTISQNLRTGIHIVSRSFGLGTGLPLDPTDARALANVEDLSFNVNIGTSAAGDGNLIEGNTQAGIAIEALDHGTGSFHIEHNTIVTSRDDNRAATPFSGDGIFVRLSDDVLPSEAISFLKESVINGNTIGVDDQGNEGNGLFFELTQRTTLQDLQVTNNNFLNNALDGFHFERSEDADLNAVVAEKNRATNNLGDGFDFLATNTTKDRLDFRLNENVISDNLQYGVRLSVLADARIGVEFDRNQVTGNGASPVSANNGFHPDDGVAGSNRAEGGIGLFAFQQADVIFNAADSRIDNNIGDGFSVDTFNFFDSLVLNATFTNTTFNGNTLTGVRNHGAAFGHIDIENSQFNSNGEDGFRSVSIEDKTDVFERRVGGMNIQLTSFNSQYVQNVQSGMQLGQGVSAVLGNGTISGANLFDGNGEDGLKITQSSGPYLAGQNIFVDTSFFPTATFQYVNRRHIEASTNFFRNNVGDGIDIGHHALTEAGNVEHGDEVVTDTHVSVSNAEIAGNGGDGIEYLADSTMRLPPVFGGGQDVEYANRSSLAVEDSRIVNNGKRGVDILNRRGEDSLISLINNEILSNGAEGVYVVNTASNMQLQNSSSDPLDAYLETFVGSSDDAAEYISAFGVISRLIHFRVSPNIELRVQDNLIESNGSITQTSTVPINVSNQGQDRSGVANTDWTHQFRQVPGTLGGLVIRVGAVDSVGRLEVANPNRELGLSGIDAEIYRNSFDGNIGADVYFDSYTSQIPAQSIGNLDAADDPDYEWRQGYRDPLSRFDLVFRENSGNSLDVINGFAFLDNFESEFKSRNNVGSSAPNHVHPELSPRGPFGVSGRMRNQTRTLGYFNDVGDVPSAQAMNLVGLPFWSYDGWGTPTWRVESDFNFGQFGTTDPSQSFSDFYDATILGVVAGAFEQSYQWDTGPENVPGFTGATPYSLSRGDIFNVGPGQAPIAADSLEENDSFAGAFDLGSVSGAGYSVNSRATNGRLSIEKKGDRDYYRFTAAGSGALNVNLNANDADGDTLYYMLYEVQPGLKSEEVAVLRNSDGTPQFVVATPGTSRTLSTTVVAGREYIIEVLGNEAPNMGTTARSFVYGTARTYGLVINAPVGIAPASVPASSPVFVSSSSPAINGPVAPGGTSTPVVAAGSVPGAPRASFVSVLPTPRSTSAGTVRLNFTEDVTGVNITDFRLTRNGVAVPLTANVFTAVSPTRYTLNLGNVSSEAGTYVATLVAANSGIRDTDSVLLSRNASVTWVVTNAVTTGADTPDANPGDRLARDANGVVSLRAAVMESNASPGADVIVLGARSHIFSRGGRYEDDSFTGDLDIKGVVTIRGTSPRTTIINAADLDRAFHVFPGATLTLENLTIIGGEAFDGGAIFNQGTVILNNVNIRQNEAYNQGGGIFNAIGSSLRVTRSSISQNVAGSRGGAVNNLGTATYISTTISTNTAVSRGGGLFNENAAVSSLINVTVARNVAASRGGGLYNESGDVRPLIAPTTTIGNTIIEGNSTTARIPATNATIGRDMFGAVRSLGTNLIQVLDRRFATGTSAGLLTSDRFGRDASPLAASLNALTYAQGTGIGAHTLRPNSLAVDGGRNAVYPVTPLLTQRDVVGNPRLIEGNRDGVVIIDVGAVERLVNTPVALFTATPNPAGLSQPVTFNGTLSTHPNPGTGRIVSWEWDFDYRAVNGFTPDAVGSTVTRAFTDVNRTSYTVRLVVTDNFGNTDFLDQVITIGIPSKPIIQRPSAVTTDRTPLFRWTADPTIYRLQLFNVTSGTPVRVLNLTNLTATSYTPTTNLALGRYELIITSINGSGSTESDSYFFRVAAVALTGPVNNTFDLTPVFNWSNIAGSSRYELRVRRISPTVVEDVIRDAFISTPTFEATASLGLGRFQWWVRAYDADNTAGEWSSPATFTIGQVVLTRPLDATVDSTPTFTWTDMDSKPAGQKDTLYELHVNQVGGAARIIYQAALTTTSYTPTVPLPNGTYNAWVRPLAPDGEAGLWSPVRRFVMDFRVGPVTSSPVGITTDTTPTFTWQAADGAANYDLWVDNLSTGATEVIRVLVPHVANADDITYTPTTPLAAGNYRWWVQTIATSGARTSFSTPTNFTVPVPSIINPRGGISNNLPLFTWNGVAEYVSYELWVDNVTTETSQVLRVNNIIGRSYQSTLPFENGSFKAWVRGRDAAGNFSQWSGVADFTVTTGVGTAPVLNFSFTNANGTRSFFWSAGSNASTYEIVVKRISDSSQPVVISQRGIQGLTYTSTTTLTAGTYRWWIRGLDSTGTPLPWSQPQTFTVAAAESASDNLTPAVADVFVPVMYTIQADNWSNDSVVSISAHPAGNVIQVNSEADDAATDTTALPAPQDVASIDSFMEDWSAAAFTVPAQMDSAAVSVGTVTPAAPVKTEESEKDNHLVDLLMAGMVVGTVLGSGKRSEDQK